MISRRKEENVFAMNILNICLAHTYTHTSSQFNSDFLCSKKEINRQGNIIERIGGRR